MFGLQFRAWMNSSLGLGYQKSMSYNPSRAEIFNAIYIPPARLSAQGARQALTQGKSRRTGDAGDKYRIKEKYPVRRRSSKIYILLNTEREINATLFIVIRINFYNFYYSIQTSRSNNLHNFCILRTCKKIL
jgi:hypothetical protein